MNVDEILLDRLNTNVQSWVNRDWDHPQVGVSGLTIWQRGNVKAAIPVHDAFPITPHTPPQIMNHFEWIMHGVNSEWHHEQLAIKLVIWMMMNGRLRFPEQ